MSNYYPARATMKAKETEKEANAKRHLTDMHLNLIEAIGVCLPLCTVHTLGCTTCRKNATRDLEKCVI